MHKKSEIGLLKSGKDAELLKSHIAKAGNPHDEAPGGGVKAIVNEMDPELKDIYERESKAYREFRDDMISFNYDRGCVAGEVRRNPRFGDKGVETLANALSVDKSTVYKTITFSMMYPSKSELNKVVQRAKDSGFDLTWSHFASVVHVPEFSDSDPHQNRKRMIERAIDEKMSVRELVVEVKSEFGGVTAKKSSSKDKAVQKLVKQVIDISLRYQTKLKNHLDDIMTDFNDVVDKIDDPDKLMENVQYMQETLGNLSEMLTRAKAYSDNFVSMAQARLARKAIVKKSVSEIEMMETSGARKHGKAR
jgi:hypothetical protein